MKWSVIITASAMPIIAGLIVGATSDPISFPSTEIEKYVSWIMYSLPLAAPLGFAVWLAWRFPVAKNRWRKFVAYGAVLAPSSLFAQSIVERVSLGLHFSAIEAFNPIQSLSRGETILDDAIPDLLFFFSLVLSLTAIRYGSRVVLVRRGESRTPASQPTVRSLLSATLLMSFVFLAVGRRWQSNQTELTRLNLAHGPFTWMDILGIVEPISSAASAAIALSLLAFAFTRHRLAGAVLSLVALAVLLMPSILKKLLFRWIEFGPSDGSVLPHRFEVIGAIVLLLICWFCLGVSRKSGLQIEFQWRNKQRSETMTSYPGR